MLHIIFEDEALLVVNKASGVLSQPGKTRDGSVVTQVRNTFSDARGPLLVHRLDMDTSGLIMLGKTRKAHRNLQLQFEQRRVRKRYTALLTHKPSSLGGLIELPVSKDWENRPKQRVNFDSGKVAVTAWRFANNSIQNSTHPAWCRVYFYPQTGRTHQLRIHAAKGLHAPIVGDRLYGQANTRLMLHADRLQFFHPVTDEPIQVRVGASF